jgi:hypothetical protein
MEDQNGTVSLFSLFLPADHFPWGNFDPFRGRDRPTKEIELIFPIRSIDTTTFLGKEDEWNGGNEHVRVNGYFRWQSISQSEKEDTSMIDASAIMVIEEPEEPENLLPAAPAAPAEH